jgi:hypothetical protein
LLAFHRIELLPSTLKLWRTLFINFFSPRVVHDDVPFLKRCFLYGDWTLRRWQ